ncbi:MAG: carboxypeptidase regulatory-like domain-containing protein [Acidobacteria bacterium]|nr:carboxypeptidase regulatory-like domain-containing protein [Acidobacteriota bacterium]
MFSLLCVATLTVFGQSTTSLRGTVFDKGGAVIPAASVTLVNVETRTSRSALTDESGVYQFLQTAPGTYTVRMEKPGFQSSLKSNIILQVSTPATLDATLEIGQVGEVVNVEADATQINTVDATIGNAFTQVQVRQLPLQTRNVVELLSIQPGVTPTGEVLGARRDQNNITLDGVDANDNQNSGINSASGSLANGSNANGSPGESGFNAALPVPLDSVQEFRVTVGGQGASLGRSSGGQVSLITKSGSNQFHGSLYEFNRNTELTANNWFSNRAGVKREALVRNQFGGSIGGRIIKDRVFFFFNHERRIDASAQARTRTVPTENLRNGILTFRASDNRIYTFNPADVKAADPLGIGFADIMKQYMSFYPAGNDPSAGGDRGLNFIGFRFNAPFQQRDKAYVAKMDFNIDTAGKHTLSVRGTLAGNKQDVVVAQFPGQDPAARLLNNSKGFAARYTGVLQSNMVNVLSVGLTRLGLNQSGTVGPSLSFDGIDAQQSFGAASRGAGRIIPTWNIADDLTWTKGSHTVTTGINFRFMVFDRNSYVSAFPSYSMSRNTLLGLGSDIVNRITSLLATKTGDGAIRLSDPANVTRGMGALLGILNQYSATYNFGKDGTAIPLGSPVTRSFATNEYDFYVQDSWRVKTSLTLTYGIRYSNFAVPYERNGVQVNTSPGIDRYFADRIGANMAGVPGFALPTAKLTFDLGGPVNGKPGWYNRDNNNFAPRLGLAYNPTGDGLMTRIFGKSSVFRAGAGLVYDRFGSDMITEFDRSGSPGLATSVTQPFNTDFTTAKRYATGLPTLPVAQSGSFPFTPPTIVGGFGSYLGIDPTLVAPYSFLLNASYAREVKGKVTVEVGYVGRLSRKNLLQVDTFQALTRFKDSKSGQDWSQMGTALRQFYDRGVTPAQVKANPSLITPQPWIENLAPGLAGLYFPGSATANYYDLVFNQYGGSDLDAYNDLDRLRSTKFPNCILVTGCNTAFPLQNAGNRTWMNVGFANYHGGTLSIRRALTKGFGFDFNYTLSHSIDNSSAAESGAGGSGAVIQDSFDYSAWRGSSDFDIRHNISTNLLFELPFGKGKKLLGGAPGWADQIVGGWQVSTVGRYRSGLPTTISNAGLYPTNYLNAAIAIPKPGVEVPVSGATTNQNGNPSLFANTNAINAFVGQYPGLTGTRAITRVAPMTSVDIAASKYFRVPLEGHRIQFRAEAFNAFNIVNFYNAALRLDRPATFGEFQSAMPARVLQLALRYEF